MLKGFAYLRVSGRSQIEGDGFERQERAIRVYAKAHGIKITNIFKELGVSGTKDIASRPAFIAMMEALHGDGIKLVLVESLGRLARDLMVQESILHDLKRHGFDLVSVTEPDLCSDDPSRKLMRQIMGAFHEYEKQMIVVKLRGARQRSKTKRGRCEGKKPFGYYPGETETLKRMKELSASGMTATDIAATLRVEGRKTRNGGDWLQPTVSKILNRAKS
ncbi:MAG TPA: recombinase family protein [Bryobacteraceae bacterium]|nr:recombinase family protein [Bryobacteraceae bacterium]